MGRIVVHREPMGLFTLEGFVYRGGAEDAEADAEKILPILDCSYQFSQSDLLSVCLVPSASASAFSAALRLEGFVYRGGAEDLEPDEGKILPTSRL